MSKKCSWWGCNEEPSPKSKRPFNNGLFCEEHGKVSFPLKIEEIEDQPVLQILDTLYDKHLSKL
jgi:hypothetical protein